MSMLNRVNSSSGKENSAKKPVGHTSKFFSLYITNNHKNEGHISAQKACGFSLVQEVSDAAALELLCCRRTFVGGRREMPIVRPNFGMWRTISVESPIIVPFAA